MTAPTTTGERVMSIDHQPSKTGLHGNPPPAQRDGKRGRLLVLLGVLAAVLAAAGVAFAVSRDGGGGDLDLSTPPVASPAPATPSAVAAPPQTPLEAEGPAILAQYNRFFQTVTPLSLAPASERAAMWAQVATGASYDRTLSGLATADANGEVAFGQITVNPVLASVEGRTAIVRDCQDTSPTGRMKKATGEKVTVGRPNSPAVVTMLKGDDDVWRVSAAEYLGGTC